MTVDGEAPLPITPDMLVSRRVDFERRMRRVPPLTLGLIGVLTAVFVLESGSGALQSAPGLIRAGALDAALVGAGQWWRLVSATLLHGSADHLLGNAAALFVMGMVCEHAFGAAQFLVLYLTSGVAGSVLSLLSSPGPSVGASGAIFGLQGAAIVLFRRHRDRLLLRDRRIGVVLLVWALYTIGGGLVSPYIDNGAHIGGAVAGALFARHLYPVVLEPMPALHAIRVRRWRRIAIVVLVYTALGWFGALLR
jgi:rhomboid protease GluP